jgi:hypothetical protein
MNVCLSHTVASLCAFEVVSFRNVRGNINALKNIVYRV